MKLPKLNRWDMVRVKWVDSAHNSRWTHIDEVNKLQICECETVGLFLLQDTTKISVALSVSDKGSEFESFDSTMSIPLCAVTKVTKLKE